MPYQPFTYSEIAMIFRLSEGALPSMGVGGVGHSGQRHVGISNAGLAGRLSQSKTTGLALFTAFLSFRDQCSAALRLMNLPGNDPVLERFRTQVRPGASFDEIKNCHVGAPVPMRYAAGDGARTFPCSYFTLVLRKDLTRPRGMHIVSFFGTMGPIV